MKNILILGLVLIVFSACKNGATSIDLDKDPLTGMLGGEPWDYKTGTSLYNNYTNSIGGLLVNFDVIDPCSIRATTLNYVEIQVPGRIGNYTLSVSPNTNVVLHLQGGVQYTVSAGFVEIVKVTANSAIGYLSADFDENNKVQGSFLLAICN